jgi:hypothetical protein
VTDEERNALVERLREWAQDIFLNLPGLYSEFRQLTDQIEADGQRIAELEAENEGLTEMLRVIENPDRKLCCSGYECGCQGATIGQYAAWAFKEEAQARSRIAELETALRDVFEEWAGSEGFIPETAPEGYLLQLVKKMALTARAALGETK